MNERSKQLENESINKLLLKLSLPATIAMMVNALYNIIDTIFVGRGVGTLGLGGLAIAFPIQMLMMGFALMIGTGAASAVSRNLGEKNIERADYVAGNTFLSIFIINILFAIFGITYVEPLLKVFGATDALLPYAKDYIVIILIGSIWFSITVAANNLVRAEGNALVSMKMMLIGAVLNIILDPILILEKINIPYLFSMPGLGLGIKGAAIATILAQFASFLYLLIYLYSGKSLLKVKLHHLKPQKDILKEIFSVGSSTFARQFAGSIVAIIINNSLIVYGGEIAIAIYGVINRVIMFLFMPLFGMVQGMQPIVGFNYGAKNLDRLKETIKLSTFWITIIAFVTTLMGELFATTIFKIFSNDPNIAINGAMYLRIVIIMVPVIGIQIVGGALFQSLGKSVPALFLSLLRGVILFVPLVIVLPKILNFGLFGVWLSFPISDLLATLITIWFMQKEMKKISKELILS